MFAFFERLLNPYQPYDDNRPPPAELFSFYRVFLWPARWILIAAALLSMLAAIAEALLIQFAGDLVDILSESSPETLWRDHGDAILWMAVIAVLIRPALIAVDVMLMGQGFFPNMAALTRWRTHRHMLRQSVDFFSDDFSGRIANKQLQLAPALNDTVGQFLETIWRAAIYLVSCAVILADIDARMLLPLGLWFSLFVLTAILFVPRIARNGKTVAEARSKLAGRIVDSYANIQTVKLFAHAEREDAYAREALEAFRAAFQSQTRLFTTMTLIITMLGVILIGGSLGFAVYLWSTAGVTIGAVAAVSALVLRLQGFTDWIMWVLIQLFQNVGVLAEGVETVSQPLRLQDEQDARPLEVSEGAVRFAEVGHHYGRDQPGGVEAVSLDIAPGERVGLVGRSGAGKSTLVNLLLRFFDPESGRVLIDGQDVAKVQQETLRAEIGMVTQDTSLLHRSILDNILYGAPDASREQAIEAARRVSAHEFIEDLEDRDGRRGYDAFVGERGVKLSGGQRQRVALARVVLKNAPILVLDEATSALDSDVEAAILEALDDLMRGKTVIAIAHRLSTIARMDRIVVMDQGRIIEQGPHAELVERDGLYARLWARQSGGFIGLEAAAE